MHAPDARPRWRLVRHRPARLRPKWRLVRHKWSLVRHSQKQPYMRMECKKLQVCPQKGAKMWMKCSFLILVDYLAVLSLGKVDSVYKLKLIIVDFSVLYLSFVYLPSLIPVKG